MFMYCSPFFKNDDGCQPQSLLQHIEVIYNEKKKYLKLVMQYSFVRYFSLSDIFLMGRIWMKAVRNVLDDILCLAYDLIIFLLGLSNRSYCDNFQMLANAGVLLISSIFLDVFSVLVVPAIGFFRAVTTVKEVCVDLFGSSKEPDISYVSSDVPLS